VVRHAGATACWISLVYTDGQATLEIRDDGRGSERAEGSGLAGMRARIAEIDGVLERDGRRGTRLRLAVPVRAIAPPPLAPPLWRRLLPPSWWSTSAEADANEPAPARPAGLGAPEEPR
jgi:hypothetical protein